MSESDKIEKVDAGVQTILHCYEDSKHNVYVASNHGVQTTISSFPLNDDGDDSIFIGLLGFIPYLEISYDCERIIILPRKRKLQWADPFTMDLTSTEESVVDYPQINPEKHDMETQTVIAVYPHILEEGHVAHVMQEIMCQTSITALPDESITNIVPVLKRQLQHTSTTQNTMMIAQTALKSTTAPGISNNPSVNTSSNPNDSNTASGNSTNDSDESNGVSEESNNAPEESNSSPEESNGAVEDSNVPIDPNLHVDSSNAPQEEQPSENIPEEIDSCKVTDPCSKSPCIEKTIDRDDCFENKVRGILQLAAEVFETELCDFFEEHPDEKKVALCKELLNFTKKSRSQNDAIKDLDKIAEDIIRPDETSGKCFCQKRTIRDVTSPVKRPSKIPRMMVQCCGKTEKFCGTQQQSSKIPVPTKRRSKVSQQIQPCGVTSCYGPGDCKEVCFTFNLPSPQLFPTIESKPQYEFNYRRLPLPSAMKRSIQVGVGQCCSTRDGIEVQETSSPEPIQNFVYECDAGYVESYLRTLGNEIKGCQTERGELGEGDWDWEEDEEEDPCLCDPWKKIAVPLPGTYVLKKATNNKLSAEEGKEQTSTNDFLSVESKNMAALNLVKLPVYDPKYFKMTELYMEPLYDYFPMDVETEDVCGPETEMPWEDIVLPEKCRIKKATPTVCTCSRRKQFSVYNKNRYETTDTNNKTLIGQDSCGAVNISAKATTTGESSTIIIHIKPPKNNDDDTNSYDSESADSNTCFKELPLKSKSTSGTCGCPKRALAIDSQGKLPSKPPGSVLQLKTKKKPLDIPSNPPKGLQDIIKKVRIRPPMQEVSCETDNNNYIDNCDQATPDTALCSKRPPERKKCSDKKSNSKVKPGCHCRATRTDSQCNNSNRKSKEISTCTSKTMTRQRAGANTISKNSVGCGSAIYVSKSAAAERDKQHKHSTKTISVSSQGTNTNTTIPNISLIKRVGHPKEIPLNDEVFELYNKGQTKVRFEVASNFENQPEDVNDVVDSQEDHQDPCSLVKPKNKKYPVVAALNAFEEEMKPLRAALCQLQKRIYSLDLPEMQSLQSIPRPTVDTAILAKGPSVVSTGLQSSTTNVTTTTTTTEQYLCSHNSEVDTLMNSSTSTSLSNDSDVSDD